MTKPWSYQHTQDKLRIFVSSRIQECKDERSIVREAIRSLSHEPVLFEHLGARTYSPRDLYLSHLHDSQVMVAIYRSGYGYIDAANGMDISGLEDEYRFAKREGIDTLFYIWSSADGREPRLQSLIDKVGSGPSVAFYKDPEKLSEMVKRDISSWITNKILSSSSHNGVIQEDSAVVLARTLSSVGFVVRRNGLIDLLIDQIKSSPILCIYGKAGIGKTTTSALLAQTIESKFARLSGLSPKEVFSVCTDVLKGNRTIEATSYTTLEGARLAVAAAWAEASNVTLVLDECEYVTELLDALSVGGGTTLIKRIVYTSRDSSQNHQNFEIPPLIPSEINEMLANSPWLHKAAGEYITEGNPLILQHTLLHFGTKFSADILNIGGTAGEILTYLALTPIPLNADQLIGLRSDDNYSIQSLSADIDKLGPIVDDSPRGYRLMHSETSASIAERIKKSPQRYGFFINRLIRLTEEYGYHRYSYELAATLEDGSARKYALRALHEAASLGDWRIAIPLVDQMLSEALDAESKSEALHLMLSLVYPLELTGNAERANDILKRSRELADQLGDSALLKVEETEISSRARRAMLANDVEDLKQIYSRYKEQGKIWDQARVGLELSAIYLAAKKSIEAAEILRPTLLIFEELGDEYGIDLAQRNLASALSVIPGNEEAERLIAIITERAEEELDTRRQRAWLCNILTRRLRTAGRYDEAKSVAREALDIANDLGDESLSAINQINLGNVYRGLKQPLDAIAMYEAAAALSQKCCRRDIEADASRLVAGIYNDFEEVEEARTRSQKAKFYAQHAIGLLRGSVNNIALACAKWELGEALESLGNTEEAAATFFEAASAYRMASEQGDCSRALTYAIELSLPDHVNTYLKGVTNALCIERSASKQALVDQFLDLLQPIMESAPKKAFIHLLSTHIGEVWSHLPPPLRRGLVKVVVENFRDFALARSGQADYWRVLYSAIVIASLLKDSTLPYLHHMLATSITEGVPDIFVREEGDGSRVWTLVLSIRHRITVSLACLDTTPASNLAGFALAVFMKAFEEDLAKDIIGREPELEELLIQIGSFDAMPEDFREIASQTLDLTHILDKQSCVVSRPTNFRENSPTCVFLGSSFLKDVSFGDISGSALQLLFGLTLTEVTFQLLHGEVEIDEIRPKIVSLVRNASP
jgi:tetratricopeptide (TPR) repeat protein